MSVEGINNKFIAFVIVALAIIIVISAGLGIFEIEYSDSNGLSVKTRQSSNVANPESNNDSFDEPSGVGAEAGKPLFINPMEKGLPVDNCWLFGDECDQAGANAYCRYKGFTVAKRYVTKTVLSTYVIGASRTCYGGCVSLTLVHCE